MVVNSKRIIPSDVDSKKDLSTIKSFGRNIKEAKLFCRDIEREYGVLAY